MSWIQESKEGVILGIHAVPGASKNQIQGLHGAALKVRLQAPPVEGKANAALVEFIAEFLGVPRRQVQLVSGQANRRKRLLIHGLSADEVRVRCQGSRAAEPGAGSGRVTCLLEDRAGDILGRHPGRVAGAA